MGKPAHFSLTLLAVGLLLIASFTWIDAGQAQAPRVQIDSNDIGGVVQGAKGPEAGVWVIAETSELPTGFIKVVVTDDGGRYVLPDLPAASYKVWVRGYGLVVRSQSTPSRGRQSI